MTKAILAIKTAIPLTAVITLLMSTSAFAADFPNRIESQRRSEAVGLEKKELPLLERVPSPGAAAVTEKLLSKLKGSDSTITTRGKFETKKLNHGMSVASQEWTLDVFDDGSHVRYRNNAYLAKQQANPVKGRLGNDRLEQLGRDFVKRNLSEQITLGPGEELVPFYTEHAIGGGGPTKPGAAAPEETVFASTIVFTRAINNVNVIGGGSKVAVTFGNDGSPLAFDYDWPQYRATNKVQKILPVAEIKERGKKLSSRGTASADVKMQSFDCGYFDAGVRKRDPNAPVQPACAVKYVERKVIDKEAHQRDPNSGHLMSATVEFIPAGETVERDMKWPQAMRMLNIRPARPDVVPQGIPERKVPTR
jgi:hypothetical protein